jgi:hypothetical protein
MIISLLAGPCDQFNHLRLIHNSDKTLYGPSVGRQLRPRDLHGYPSTHCAHPRITILERRRQANEIDGHPCENRRPKDGDSKQGGAYSSVFRQERGVGGIEPVLHFVQIAIFLRFMVPPVWGGYHPRACVKTSRRILHKALSGAGTYDFSGGSLAILVVLA